MRPRLRDHVLFTERPDGTHVQGPHGGMLLRGAGLYPWLTRLAPFLTGEHTLAELVGELPPERRGRVERLIGRLARGGYVRGHSPGAPPRPGRTTREQPGGPPPHDGDAPHAGQLAFLGYTADQPELRLERLREARVTVSGSCRVLPVLTEVARLGPHSGWCSVRTEVRERAGGASDARAHAGDSDLLIWVTDQDEPPPQTGWEAWCPVRLMAGAAWVGPVWGTGDECGTAEPGGGAGTPGSAYGTSSSEAAGGAAVGGGAVGVVAAQAVLLCTRYLAGLEGGPSVTPAVRVDLTELTTTEHPVTRGAAAGHPEAPHRTAEAVSAWWASAALPEPELWDRVAPLVDPYTGILREVSPGHWLQHPWWTCGAVLADGTRVGAHGSTREAARALAVLRALSVTASPGGPVWGWDLAAGAPRLLTGRAVAEVLSAGLGPAEAAREGLRSLAEREVARRLADQLGERGAGQSGERSGGRNTKPSNRQTSERDRQRSGRRDGERSGRPPGAQLTAREITERLAAHHRAAPSGIPGGGERELLRATGCEVRVFDLSAVLWGVPAYAVTLDGDPVVLRCGDQPGATLAEALGLALLAWQAAHDEDAAYAPRPVPPLPRLADVLPSSGGEVPARPLGLLPGLAAAGLRPVAVPLSGGGPHEVKVVLVGAEEELPPAGDVRRANA